jgi:DNA polymerase III subunit epsilon
MEIESIPLEKSDFCIVDIETTGLSPRTNNIIEIGIVKVSGLKIVDRFSTFINPGRNIPFFITSLTGISDEDVYDAPFFDDIAYEINKFISGSILAGHNLAFDYSFLRREFTSSGFDFNIKERLCTMRLARRLFPMEKSKSLASMCTLLNIRNSKKHRALGDAEATAQVLLKMLSVLKSEYKINTADDVIAFQSVPKKEKKAKVNKRVAEEVSYLPDSPGVYYFINSKNEIIYIGKAKSLKDRIRNYFSPGAPAKAKKIVTQARNLRIQITNSELTALLYEAEMIKLVNPKHNSQLKKYGNKFFLRILLSHPYPSLEITNFFDFDGNDYFGLFISRDKAESIVDILQKTFSLRECSDNEFNKKRRCLLSEIERCTAPCVTGNKDEYYAELERVYEFLYGKDQYAVTRLLTKMRDYSSRQKYEKAAEMKNIVDLILKQTHKSSLIAEPVNNANVLFEIDEGFGRDYIAMIKGKIYLKKPGGKDKKYFEDAIDDYFEGTLNLSVLPDEEDLEKMKITLNWLIKHRNNVRIFYLKDYSNKAQLFSNLKSSSFRASVPDESVFDINTFLDTRALKYEPEID